MDFLLVIILGKGWVSCKSCGRWTIPMSTIYKPQLKMITPTIIPRPKEKIMTNKDAIIDTIKRVNNDTGSPNIIARFLIFL